MSAQQTVADPAVDLEESDADEEEDAGSGNEEGISNSFDDLPQPGGMTVLVCGQPNEHRAQSAKRRMQSAQLRRSADTVQLAGVKQELYNPALPSLRRMDMDDVGQRLTNEHSRATSALTRRSFHSARTAFFQPAERIPSKRITENSQPLETRLRIQSAKFPTQPLPWTNILQSTVPSHQRATTEPARKLPIIGFTSRYISSRNSQSWKLNLHGATGVDKQFSSQHIIPSDYNYQYRSPVPQYGLPAIHTSSWR